ncbi:MAG TPA: glycine--tRNA ligase subunit alpha, partial [Dissulfuribacter thermophilus]|nr:glycine--tRNA ligase subunit alpha [Dissulfuribacter thermophilus]
QVGGIDCEPVAAEITYGLERIAMYLQGVDNVYDLKWNDEVTYGEVHLEDEKEFSRYNFEEADIESLETLFGIYEREAESLLEKGLVLPAYDMCLKCSHTFNLLDARGALSVQERTNMIARVRKIARGCASGYTEKSTG